MPLPLCVNCEHASPHNLWGRCSTPECGCTDLELSLETYFPTEPDSTTEENTPETVMVTRDPVTETPVVIPSTVAIEGDRVYKAFHAHVHLGKTWPEIASDPEDPWESPQAVAAEVQRYLDRGRVIWGSFTANEMLALKIGQLDALLAGVWPKAIGGSLTHVNGARKIITEQIRYAGWGRPVQEEGADSNPDTVVGLPMVRDDDGAYVADLKMVVNNTRPDETETG